MTRPRFTARKGGLMLAPFLIGATAFLGAPAMAAPGKGGDHACHGGMMHARMHGPMARISVTGLGEATTQPDLAVITLGVTTQAESAGEALTQNSAQQSAVMEALQAAGIEPRDLQTSGLSLNPMRDYSREGQPPVITGYQAQNMLTVRVRDLDGLGQTLDALVAAGANEINGISFAREAADEVQDEARRQAVANARHSAEVMAEAAGLTLGPVLTMRDTVSSSGPEPVEMRAMSMKDASGAVPVAAGELTMTALVEMQFALTGEAGMGDCGGKGHGRRMKDGHEGGDMMPEEMPQITPETGADDAAEAEPADQGAAEAPETEGETADEAAPSDEAAPTDEAAPADEAAPTDEAMPTDDAAPAEDGAASN